jgi:hypothetical protein
MQERSRELIVAEGQPRSRLAFQARCTGFQPPVCIIKLPQLISTRIGRTYLGLYLSQRLQLLVTRSFSRHHRACATRRGSQATAVAPPTAPTVAPSWRPDFTSNFPPSRRIQPQFETRKHTHTDDSAKTSPTSDQLPSPFSELPPSRRRSQPPNRSRVKQPPAGAAPCPGDTVYP